MDFCWRLQNRGYAIGFSPAAMVWHFRRNTVKAYLKQQMGYGKAEALLYFKHPYRFNMLGQSRWLGRIYGELTHAVLSRRPVIYFGAFGRGLFQTLYEPPSSLLSYLPFTLEWNAIGVLLFLAGAGVAARAADRRHAARASRSPGRSAPRGARASTRASPGLRARALIALLTYLGPLVRGLQRYLWRLRGLTRHRAGRAPTGRGSRRAIDWLRARVRARATGASRGTRRRRSSAA